MKTRLYSLIATLLMAACLTSHAQEIVNECMILKMDKDFFGCNIFENEDGTPKEGETICAGRRPGRRS